jgi:hypothetical protein
MPKPRKPKKRNKARESWDYFDEHYRLKERRTFPAYATKIIGRYAKLAGEIIWASNELQAALSWMFDSLVDSETRKTFGIAIWHAVKTDSAQRAMFAAAAKNTLPPGSRLLAELLWLEDAAGKVSGYRNDVVHTPMGHRGTLRFLELGPDHLAPPVRAERIMRHGYKRLFPLIRGDLIALTTFAYRLLGRVARHSTRESWPKRPRLLSHELLHPAKAPKSRRASPSKGRKRQPPPSGA